jgi:lysophospholipase L1-like esterase
MQEKNASSLTNDDRLLSRILTLSGAALAGLALAYDYIVDGFSGPHVFGYWQVIILLAGGVLLALGLARPLRGWLARNLPYLLLMGGSLLMTFLLLEGFLRWVYDPLDRDLSETSVPVADYQKLFMADPLLSYRLVPGTEIVFEETGVVHGAAIQINDYGFRGERVDLDKPPGTVRILFIGDSIVFGVGADGDETIPFRLETYLNQNAPAGIRFEVMNWGTQGYNLTQELGLLRELEAERFQPDLILVGTGPNDYGQSLKPNTYQEEGGLIGDTAALEAFTTPQPVEHSEQVRFSIRVKEWLNRVKTLRLIRYGLALIRTGLERSFPEATGEQADSTRADLEALTAYAEETGIPLAFVIFPDEHQIKPVKAEYARQFSYYHSLYAFYGVQLDELEVPWFGTYPLVQEASLARRESLFLENDPIHLNPAGNDVVGRALATWILDSWDFEAE